MGNATTVMALGSEYDTARAAAMMASIAKMQGVESVDFNYTMNKVTVKFDSDRLSLKVLEGVILGEKRHRNHSAEKVASRIGDSDPGRGAIPRFGSRLAQ